MWNCFSSNYLESCFSWKDGQRSESHRLFCFANEQVRMKPTHNPAPHAGGLCGSQHGGGAHLGAHADGCHHKLSLGEPSHGQLAVSTGTHPTKALLPFQGALPSASPGNQPRPSAASAAPTAAVLLPDLLHRHHVVLPIAPQPFCASCPFLPQGQLLVSSISCLCPTSYLRVPPPSEDDPLGFHPDASQRHMAAAPPP